MIYSNKISSFLISFVVLLFCSSLANAVGPGESLGGAPQRLEEFTDGCYGTGSGFRTILIPEKERTIGFVYLIDNPAYSGNTTLSPYNVVLCKNNKLNPLDTSTTSEKTYYSLYHYFSDSDNNPLFINFIIDDNNGLFTFTKNGDNWQLSTAKQVLYIRDEVRYGLLGLSVLEKKGEGEDENSLAMVPSLEIAVQQVVKNKEPKWDSHIQFTYPSTCNLRSASGGPSYCPQLLKVPLVKGGTFSYKIHAIDSDPYSYTSEGETQKSYKTREPFYDFKLLKEEYNSRDKITELVEDTSDDGASFDDLFEFDSDTFQLKQKEDVVLTIEDSPYIIKVSAEEGKVNTSLLSQSNRIIVADNSGNHELFAAILDDEGSSTEFNLYISVVEPSTYEASPSTPKPVSVTSSGRGGKDELVLRRLRGETPLPISTPKVLVCPTKKYNRYPDQRNLGVDAGLFTDASVSHRAYKGLIDLAEQKIVNGDNETGDARLDDTISRAEFVKIMTIAREDTLLLGDCLKLSNFYDVDHDAWYTPFIQNLEQKAIVKGYTDNNYRPGKSINLVEAYKIIALSFDYISLEDAHKIVNDQNIQWYVPYVQALEKGGVIPEWMRNYEMNAEISRGDMFALLANVLRQKDWMKNINWN